MEGEENISHYSIQEDKVSKSCLLCTNKNGDIHEHLLQACATRCPFGCKGYEDSKLLAEHMSNCTLSSTHLIGLMLKIDGIKKLGDNSHSENIKSDTSSTLILKDILQKLLNLENRHNATSNHLTMLLNNKSSIKDEHNFERISDRDKIKKEIKELSKVKDALDECFVRFIFKDSLKKQYPRLTKKIDYQMLKLFVSHAGREKRKELISRANISIAFSVVRGCLIWQLISPFHYQVTEIIGQKFYTSGYGYALLPKFYPYGREHPFDGICKLYVSLQSTSYDPVLKWPFLKKMKVTVLNQLDRSHDITRTMRPDLTSGSAAKPMWGSSPGFGTENLAPTSLLSLEENGFLCNGLLFILIEISDMFEDEPIEVADTE